MLYEVVMTSIVSSVIEVEHPLVVTPFSLFNSVLYIVLKKCFYLFDFWFFQNKQSVRSFGQMITTTLI